MRFVALHISLILGVKVLHTYICILLEHTHVRIYVSRLTVVSRMAKKTAHAAPPRVYLHIAKPQNTETELTFL